MKNRMTVRHGMLNDLKNYLVQSGWILEKPVGEYNEQIPTYKGIRIRKPTVNKIIRMWDRRCQNG